MSYETQYSLNIHETHNSEYITLTNEDFCKHLSKNLPEFDPANPEKNANEFNSPMELQWALINFYNEESVKEWFVKADKEWNDEYYDVFRALFLNDETYYERFYFDRDMTPLLEVITSQPEFKDLICVVNFTANEDYENFEGKIYAQNGIVKTIFPEVSVSYPDMDDVMNSLQNTPINPEKSHTLSIN